MSSVMAVLLIRWLQHPIHEFSSILLLWMVLSIVCSLLGFLLMGTHKIVIKYSSYRSIGVLAYAVLIKELLLGVCLLTGLVDFLTVRIDVLVLCADLFFTLTFLILARVFIISLNERLQDSMEVNVGKTVAMVYGTSDKSVAMVTRLSQSKHYDIVGYLSPVREEAGKILQDRRVYYFDDESQIEKMKLNMGFQCVIFTRDIDAEDEQDRLVKICLHQGIHMFVSPKVEETDFGGISQHSIKEVLNNDFIPDGMSPFERIVKRVVDCALAGLLLLIFAIPMAICWLAIKIGDGGPAIYKQERIGRFGRPFNIYKFRSMRLDAESAGPTLFGGDDDPRLTKVGKFLRQHHLDEMPQLWNVFIGDMAFVGYRPERKFFIDQIMERDPRYYYLYQIRPGVTSYATLRNGYTDSMDKMIRRLEFDLYYLRHRSWWFDVKVLWQTFMSIIFGKKF